MAEAFTAGVKPGGLTDDTQIRILLCYLIKTAGPLTRDTLQGALLQEQLVNYFEFADALAEVQKQGLVTCTDEQYSITDKGASVASTLAHDLPRTVRESAIRAVMQIQSWRHKAASNRAHVEEKNGKYVVQYRRPGQRCVSAAADHARQADRRDDEEHVYCTRQRYLLETHGYADPAGDG